MNFYQKIRNMTVIEKGESVFCLILVLVIIFLHVVNFHYSAVLLHDEVNSVVLSGRSLFQAIHDDLAFDVFPPLSIIVFHLWGLISNSDQSFRFLGLMIGLTTVAAIWFNSKIMKLGLPILALAFFELNFITIRYTEYVRAYSLGVLFIILSYGLIWKLLEQEFSWKYFIASAVVGICSVQSIYQNGFLLFAICVSAAFIALEARRYKKIAEILGIGMIAAVSLLPYLNFIESANSWLDIVRSATGPGDYWQGMVNGLGLSWPILGLILVTLFITGILLSFRKSILPERKNLFLYGAVTLVVSSTLFLGFLIKTKIPPLPHYYLTWFAVVVLSLETIFTSVVSVPNHQKILKVVIGLGILILMFNPVLTFVKTRSTNIDIIANRLESSASQKDLILINPWMWDITFNRYYKGDATWMTWPPLNVYSIFKYQELKDKIDDFDPTMPANIAIEQTLKSGGRVWVLGFVTPTNSQPDKKLLTPYVDYWTRQLNESLAQHKLNGEVIDLGIKQTVNPYEDFQLRLYKAGR